MAQNHNGVTQVPRSFSQLKVFLACGKQYQLEKELRVPRRPGVWFPAGTAVHATVERYLRETLKETNSAAS